MVSEAERERMQNIDELREEVIKRIQAFEITDEVADKHFSGEVDDDPESLARMRVLFNRKQAAERDEQIKALDDKERRIRREQIAAEIENMCILLELPSPGTGPLTIQRDASRQTVEEICRKLREA